MVTVSSAGSLMDNMLGDINYDEDKHARELYPFKVRVGVIKFRPPRHEFFEYILDMGMAHIEKILYEGDTFDPPSDMTFVFPERWMSAHEQRSFMYKMCKMKNVDKIRQVDIITSSPLMISDFMGCMIRIITWPDDQKYEKLARS